MHPMPKHKDWRWGSLLFCVEWLLARQVPLQGAWSRRSFAGSDGGSEAFEVRGEGGQKETLDLKVFGGNEKWDFLRATQSHT